MNPSMHRMAVGGFTLIEIVVVVLVLSILALMAYGGLNTVVKDSQHIEQVSQRSASLQRVYIRLRNDFQNLRDRPMRDAFGDAQPSVFVDVDGGLNFVRGGWRNPLGDGRSSLERVRYSHDDGEIKREGWSTIDLIQEAKPSELVLLDEVDSLKLRFMDALGEWRETWPPGALPGASASAAQDPPPIAVDVTLTTPDWGEIRLLFRTSVAGLAQRASGTRAVASQASGPAPKLLTQAGLLPGNAVGAIQPASVASGDEIDATNEPDETDPATPAPAQTEELL